MRRTRTLLIALLVPAMLAGCGGGGGGGSTPSTFVGGSGGSSESSFSGTRNCDGCHAAGDLETGATLNTAAASWEAGVHNVASGTRALSDGVVNCEECHGNLNQHGGFGPVETPRPTFAKCGECHGPNGPYASAQYATFLETAHANGNSRPEKFFFQTSAGTEQATSHGEALWKDVAGTRPVSRTERIEECGACHNHGQKAADIENGRISDPVVGCNACHDGHRPADRIKNYVTSRTADGSSAETPNRFNLNFRVVKVDGKTVRPRNQFEWNKGNNTLANHAGYTAQLTTAATHEDDYNRITVDYLCASCHSSQPYLHTKRQGAALDNLSHNNNVWAQYKNSGHGDPAQLAFEEFSSHAPLSDGTPQAGHRPVYPIDMGGRLSDKSTKGTLPTNPGVSADNGEYACFQCHNGIATIDYMNGVQGENALDANPSGQSHVVFGDYTVGCITCHDPHKKGSASNLRVPKYMSYNGEFTAAKTALPGVNARGGVAGKFLDLQSLPPASSSTVCLFCHQGRESGWTIWNKIRAAKSNPDFIYTNPTTSLGSFSFVNDHYLAGGSTLFSANAYEFAGERYSKGIPAHQVGLGEVKTNCVGCHMADPNATNTEGGHTWKAPVEKCQECHGSVADVMSIPAVADYDGDGAVETAHDEIGALARIPANGETGYPGHGSEVYGTGIGGTGLFGRLNEALWDQGVEFDPNSYPYFFKAGMEHKSANAFKAFSPNLLGAANNLATQYKSNGAAHVHNVFYTSQLLIDSLERVPAFGQPLTGTGHTGDVNAFARPTYGEQRDAIDYRNQTIQ